MNKPKIGWIGLGVIGGACARRALEAGYELAVYSRTRAKAKPLVASGAIWRDSPREVAEISDVVFSCVGYPRDVSEIFYGENGIAAAWKNQTNARGAVYVDMTTSSPDLAAQIAADAARFGFSALDAPVSGGDVGARNGTLSIMVGGDENALVAVRPILENFGKNIARFGAAGSGQRAKMANQIVIAGNMIGMCEALLYASKAGLDVEKTLKTIASGAAGSWSLSNLGPRIIKGDFEPGFFVEHFVKDMTIALEDARRLGLSLPGLALVHQLYVALVAQGGAKRGTQALVKALETLSNVDAF